MVSVAVRLARGSNLILFGDISLAFEVLIGCAVVIEALEFFLIK